MTENDKYTKNKMLGIRYYPHELEEINKIAKDLKISPSDLAREAIREKIERIKNPELESIKVNSNTNTLEMEEIQQKLNSLIGHVKELTEINTKLLTIKLDFPSKLEEINDLDEKLAKIIKVMKNHRRTKIYKTSKTLLTLEEISEKTKINDEIIFDILINSDKFKHPANKRGWDLKDE